MEKLDFRLIVGQLKCYPMVVESWESLQGNLNVPLWARHFFKRLRIECTKAFTAELMNVSGLWDLNEKKVELLYLLVFEVLEVKHDLDRTCMKK